MLIMAVFLLVAVGFAAHFDWDDDVEEKYAQPSFTALCVFKTPIRRDTIAFESTIANLLLIVYGYTIRIVKSIEAVSNWLRKRPGKLRKMRDSLDRNWKPEVSGQKALEILKNMFFRPLGIAFLMVVDLHLELFTSYMAEVSLDLLYWPYESPGHQF